MKLIVSDLDGTLLQKNEVSLNKNIKNSIHAVLNSGNKFAVASGRNYVELKHLFKEFEDDIYFICNDGTLGVYKEETFFDMPMDKSMFVNFKNYTAHGKYITYIKGTSSLFVRKVTEQYRNHVVTIDSVDDIPEDIYKISDFDKKIPCPLPIVYQNHLMNEYVTEGADKAHAVEALIKLLNISKEKTYAFGDNINDIGMFKVCGTAIAAPTALRIVKKSADKVTYNISDELINVL